MISKVIGKMSSVEYAAGFVNKQFGHVLEFGVWRGDSIAKIRKRFSKQFKVYGFDSFEGLPEDWLDGKGRIVGSGRKGRFTTNGKPPNIPGVKFYKGWFTDTLPQYLKEAKPIALLHIDCDLYSSTKEVLNALNKYIMPGTIIVFDEWFYNHHTNFKDHEQKAFLEWVKESNRNYRFINYDDPTDKRHPITGKKYQTSEKKIVKITK